MLNISSKDDSSSCACGACVVYITEGTSPRQHCCVATPGLISLEKRRRAPHISKLCLPKRALRRVRRESQTRRSSRSRIRLRSSRRKPKRRFRTKHLRKVQPQLRKLSLRARGRRKKREPQFAFLPIQMSCLFAKLVCSVTDARRKMPKEKWNCCGEPFTMELMMPQVSPTDTLELGSAMYAGTTAENASRKEQLKTR